MFEASPVPWSRGVVCGATCEGEQEGEQGDESRQRPLRRGPGLERQSGVRPFPDREAGEVAGRVVEERNQPCLPDAASEAEFSEVPVEDLHRPDLRLVVSGQQVSRTSGVTWPIPEDGSTYRFQQLLKQPVRAPGSAMFMSTVHPMSASAPSVIALTGAILVHSAPSV